MRWRIPGVRGRLIGPGRVPGTGGGRGSNPWCDLLEIPSAASVFAAKQFPAVHIRALPYTGVMYEKGGSKVCARCGETFFAAHRNALYCSGLCRESAWAYVPRPKRFTVCAGCWVLLEDTRRCRAWCSSECKHRSLYVPHPKRVRSGLRGPSCRLSQRPVARSFIGAVCRGCGVSFVVAPYADGKRQKGEPLRARYCTVGCQVRTNRRAGKALRRARLKGATGAVVIRSREIFERDGWSCRLCLKPVDRAAVVPADLAATLDHILPLSLGGLHEYSNVQCAHFICNSLKSANVVQLSFAA
jgi:5-methylcytosine-specific restriction endonuclease McrA/ribosomal protein S27AE